MIATILDFILEDRNQDRNGELEIPMETGVIIRC
jgi:hypothetical protein